MHTRPPLSVSASVLRTIVKCDRRVIPFCLETAVFVVVYKPNSGIWAFQTDKTVVHISHSETSDCLYVTLEDAASAGDDNGHSDHHYACNGD